MREDDLREALRTEASAAQVPSDVMLQQIRRKAGRTAAPRWRVVTEVAAATVAVAAMVGTLVFFASRPKAGTATIATPAVVQPPETVQTPLVLKPYENKDLEVRFTYPSTLKAPTVDAQGVISLKLDGLDLTVSRRDRGGKDLEGLLAELTAGYAQQGSRLRLGTRDITVVNGRPGVYVDVLYVSAGAGFWESSYIIPAGQHEYLVTCGSRNYPSSQLSSDYPKAACNDVLRSLEVEWSQGLLSQEQAVAIALKQVPQGYVLNRISLDETFRGLDGKSPAFPIWRVRVGKGSSGEENPIAVVIDAKTGVVIDQRPD